MLLAMPDVIKKERINKQLVKIMNQAIKTVNSMCKKEVDNQVLQVGSYCDWSTPLTVMEIPLKTTTLCCPIYAEFC